MNLRIYICIICLRKFNIDCSLQPPVSLDAVNPLIALTQLQQVVIREVWCNPSLLASTTKYQRNMKGWLTWLLETWCIGLRGSGSTDHAGSAA